MKLSLAHILASSSFCFIVILFRSGYRLLSRCNIHVSCHRTWHNDDGIMAFAVLPLVGRAICSAFVLEYSGPDASPGNRIVAARLLIVSRLSYAVL